MTDMQKWEAAMIEAASHSSGASAKTARQDRLDPGVAASERMAATDWGRIIKHLADIDVAAQIYCIPPALIFAIISRESRGGRMLRDGWGDDDNGWGVMQIDKGHHTIDLIDIENGPWHPAHLIDGVVILDEYRAKIIRKFPSWPVWAQLKGAVVAYNSGPRNVQTIAGMDRGTTGGDYGDDTLSRARWYHARLGGAT